jgi:purine-binding chemotaxis protein CheW
MLDNGGKVFIEMGQRQREESDQDQSEEALSLLTFCLEKEWYGVPSSQVKEVTRIPKITPVPGTPDYILGVAHHSGEILSVIDIKPLIGLDRTTLTEKSRLLIFTIEGEPAGLLIEIVQDIVEITKEKIEPYLSGAGGEQKGYLTGQIQIGEVILGILDLEKLFCLGEKS